jgi:Trypsin-co-occurring domain 2
MAEVKASAVSFPLADAIEELRRELLTAIAAGAGQPIQFPIAKMTIQLQVVATKGVDGKVGFTVPVVGAQLGGGGSWEHERTQNITIEFGSPVDKDGRPVKVASESDVEKG